MKTILRSFLWCALFPGSISAQTVSTLKEAAIHANDPVARINKLQFQPNYYIYYGGGNQFNLTTRMIHSFSGIFLPYIKAGDPAKVSLPVLKFRWPARHMAPIRR